MRWVPLLVAALAAGLFTYWNGAERVTLHAGVATFYRLPLALVVLGAFVLGMVVMFLLGLPSDLRVRRALRNAEREQVLERRPTATLWPDESPPGPM
jgi:uncharacterized integral membrane protein